MEKFTCDGCWASAVLRARLTDGRVDKWYTAYHTDAHKRQGLGEISYSRNTQYGATV